MRFIAQSVIRCTPERVFAFHELPDALQRLTPSWIHARVVQNPSSLGAGSRSVVDIRIAPLIWARTESLHTIYEPLTLFADEQVRGPFRSWRHRHEIAPCAEGARLTDAIELEPPFGIIGRWLAPLLILPRLRTTLRPSARSDACMVRGGSVTMIAKEVLHG